MHISLFLNASKYCGSVLKNDFVVVVVVVVGVLMNFYHIFKESDYFKSLVETCPKRKIVVGADKKYISKKLITSNNSRNPKTSEKSIKYL